MIIRLGSRNYLLYRPLAPTPRNLPVLIALHGTGGSPLHFTRNTGLLDHIDKENLIIAFPDAGNRQWNDGRPGTDDGIGDVAFLRLVITDIVRFHQGDPTRVLITGVSNGGMMAQRMACEAADVITAASAVSALKPVGLTSTPSQPVPMVLMASRTDPIVPWNGGRIKSPTDGIVLSAFDTLSFWSGVNGCSGLESTSDLPGIITHRAIDCQSPNKAVLHEVLEGGHEWFPQATEFVLDFFRPYGLKTSKRYYSCSLTGSGTGSDMFRAVIHDTGITYRCIADERPLKTSPEGSMIVEAIVSEARHVILTRDPRIVPLNEKEAKRRSAHAPGRS